MPRIKKLQLNHPAMPQSPVFDVGSVGIPEYSSEAGDIPYGSVSLPEEALKYGTHVIYTAPADGLFYITLEGSGVFAEVIATLGVIRPGASSSFVVTNARLPNDEAASLLLFLHQNDEVELTVDNSTHSASGVKLTSMTASFLRF